MMPTRTVQLHPITSGDAEAIQRVYAQSPGHFERIGIEVPVLADVEREVDTILSDPQRRAYLIRDGEQAVGYLDLKQRYPSEGEATVTLILIAEPYRGRGYGRTAIADLEAMLAHDTQRLYAAVYGHNPGAVAFWKKLGYRYLKDGGPTLSWYYKRLS
ncbi:N-acetyltransferase family protein [Oceanithermus sp.]